VLAAPRERGQAMAKTAKTTTPRHLWIVGTAALLWNAFGSYDQIVTLTTGQGHRMAAWQAVFWGLLVWGGLAGSILLLMRNRYAVWAFGLSFIGALVGTYPMFEPAVPIGLKGLMVGIILIAAFLLWYSWKQAPAPGGKRRTAPSQATEVGSIDAKQATRGTLVAAAVGGVAGSIVTAIALLVARPDSEEIVREGLLGDPQVLAEASEILRGQQTAVAANRGALEAPFGSSWRGAAKPDVVLVEFFDYACAYCRASQPDITRLLSEDKGLRVVYRELPILGPDSQAAARVSLAASKAGRFGQFHDALFAAGMPSADTIQQAASTAGVEPIRGEDPVVEAEIDRTLELARKLTITGTPSFVIGGRLVKGAVGYDSLKSAITAARRRTSRS
jgi:protein-disulfide isomerase